MMKYIFVDLPFHEYSDGNAVFVQSRAGFEKDFGKVTPALGQGRQQYFHSWLDRLVEHLGTDLVPVFLEWNTGERTRMDKGCVGHAIAAGKIVDVECAADGTVNHVRIST